MILIKSSRRESCSIIKPKPKPVAAEIMESRGELSSASFLTQYIYIHTYIYIHICICIYTNAHRCNML